MSCDKDFTSLSRQYNRDAALRSLHDERQLGHSQDVLLADFRMAAVRHVEDIVEAPEYGQPWQEWHLALKTEMLFTEPDVCEALEPQ